MTNIDKVNFSGKRVIVRVDFNVPLDDNFNITDDTRMRAAMPTLKKVLSDNGMLIIMSHLGRPKKNPDPKNRNNPTIRRSGTAGSSTTRPQSPSADSEYTARRMCRDVP